MPGVQRFSCAAAALLAACFSEAPALMDSSTTSATTSSTTTGSSSGDSGSGVSVATSVDSTSEDVGLESSTTAGPICGDGIVDEPQETCDDGNEMVADGCTACTVSGTIAWLETRGAAGDEEGAYDVAIDEDGLIAVVGSLRNADAIDAWVAVYDPFGDVPWSRTPSGGGAGDEAFFGVAFDEDRVVATGSTRVSVTDSDVWVQIYEAVDGDPLDDGVYDDGGYPDIGIGVAITGIDGVVVGASVTPSQFNVDGWLAHFESNTFDPVQRVVDLGQNPLQSGILSLAGAGVVSLRIALRDQSMAQLWASEDGLGTPPVLWDSLAELPTDAELVVDVTADGSTMLCSAIPSDERSPALIWLRAYDADSTLRWTRTYELDAAPRCGGLEILAESGHAVLAGNEGGGVDAVPWVARVDANGDIVWSSKPAHPSAGLKVHGLAVDPLGFPVIVGQLFWEADDSDAFVAKLVP